MRGIGVYICIAIVLVFLTHCRDSTEEGSIPVITVRKQDDSLQKCPAFHNRLVGHDSVETYMYYQTKDSCSYGEATQKQMLKHMSKYKDWLVFVHGNGKTFEEAADRGLRLKKIYDVGVLVYAWPSETEKGSALKNVRQSKEYIRQSLSSFRSFLAQVRQLKQAAHADTLRHISLMLHSLGNYYLKQGVQAEIFDEGFRGLFDNLIMNAPAVNLKGHFKWLDQINMQKRLFVHYNPNDIILRIYQCFTGAGPQLGRTFHAPPGKHVRYINFSQTVGWVLHSRATHTYFIEVFPGKNGPVRKYYTQILHGLPAASNDSLSLKRDQYPHSYILMPSDP